MRQEGIEGVRDGHSCFQRLMMIFDQCQSDEQAVDLSCSVQSEVAKEQSNPNAGIPESTG